VTTQSLADRLCTPARLDAHPFQRRARMLQSLWREERGYACGEHRGMPLGSRLCMPMARDELTNFLTPGIRAVVREEVLDAVNRSGKLFSEPRIFNDLLSSQPLCFNLFAELRTDLALASQFVSHFTQGRFRHVVAVAFEHAPSPRERYTEDRSAFDVFLECRTSSGGRGFLGIEVKYHENLKGSAAGHRSRYDEVATMMGCFRADAAEVLRRQPLQQLWRDHVLSGALQHVDGYDDAQFVTLYPRDNAACRDAVADYRATLTDTSSFDTWILEDVVDHLASAASTNWLSLVYDRYCDFARLDRALAAEAV